VINDLAERDEVETIVVGSPHRGAVGLRIAAEVGADETVKAGKDAAEAIREITGGRGAELVVDMVGSDETIALSAAIAKFESELTIVGLAGGKCEFAFGALPFEAKLCIPYWGTAVELMWPVRARSTPTSSASPSTRPRALTKKCAKATSTAAP
jgi:threonine dehydrogenase-like Zn-dependent dehydrogenase